MIRPGACRCENSAGFLPTNWVLSLFLSLKKDDATVFCSCIGMYHTILYHIGVLRKKAPSSQGCCGTCWHWVVKRLPAFFLPLIQVPHFVKRYSERPKTITLTLNPIFQIEVLPTAHLSTARTNVPSSGLEVELAWPFCCVAWLKMHDPSLDFWTPVTWEYGGKCTLLVELIRRCCDAIRIRGMDEFCLCFCRNSRKHVMNKCEPLFKTEWRNLGQFFLRPYLGLRVFLPVERFRSPHWTLDDFFCLIAENVLTFSPEGSDSVVSETCRHQGWRKQNMCESISRARLQCKCAPGYFSKRVAKERGWNAVCWQPISFRVGQWYSYDCKMR